VTDFYRLLPAYNPNFIPSVLKKSQRNIKVVSESLPVKMIYSPVMFWIIQIPSYNEALCLGTVLCNLPRRLPGIDRIETLVIDDGSLDETCNIAAESGVDHILRLERHTGLAAAFYAGIQESLRLGADGIINLDADGQYDPGDLPALTAPILAEQADMVVGDRSPARLEHFPLFKRRLEAWGSRFISTLAGFPIPDAVCGLRAWNRQAAGFLRLQTRFSYTISSLLQAKNNRLDITFVHVSCLPARRPSRLADSSLKFIMLTAIDLLIFYLHKKPSSTFAKDEKEGSLFG
jgi:glycosyltransferase involved in cell wall biosynthesis